MMHHAIVSYSGLGLVAVFAFASVAGGQAQPDPSLWTPADVVNPSGLRPVPVVEYDPATGLLSVNTLGLNGADDTRGQSAIGGDDVGLVSILVEGPPATDMLLDGFSDGLVWAGAYFIGKQQLFAVTLPGSEFLPIGTTPIFMYPARLGSNDFGTVEVGVNFTGFMPGATIFGSVQIACEGDVNGDGVVSVQDLVLMISAWNTADPAADLNGDGNVGVPDLILMITGWGDCP